MNIPGIPVLIVCGKVLDRVIGAIEGRTDKIIHPGVHHQEIPALPFLDENNLSDKRSALSHNGASRLDVDGLVWTADKLPVYGSEPGLEIRHRIRVRVIVVDTKASAQIYIPHNQSLGLEQGDNLSYSCALHTDDILDIQNLGANVELEPEEIKGGI